MKSILQVRKSHPYLSTERFPHNWAVADMVKGYLAGTRKEHYRQAREGEHGTKQDITRRKRQKRTTDSDTDEMPQSSAGTNSGKSKRRVRDDNEDQTDEELEPTSSRTSKSGRSTKHVQRKPGREENHPSSGTDARSGSNANPRKTKKRDASDTLSDTEDHTQKRRRGSKDEESEAEDEDGEEE